MSGGVNDIKTPAIFIDKRGGWFQDGVPITHRWTYLENNRNLRKNANGGFEVAEGETVIPVTVEDAPFVIVSAELTTEGIKALVNDETTELLTGENELTVNAENVPYATIKGGEFRARFLTRAYYAIAGFASPLAGGGFAVEFAGKKYDFPLR